MTRGEELFRGKKITLMGLGLLGRSLGDAKYLATSGAELIVTDLKNQAELKTSLAQLTAWPQIKFTLGRHESADFRGRDLIIRAANVPPDSPFLKLATESGTPITQSVAIFAREARKLRAHLVGVTGTRGKSTVTHLLFEILRVNFPRVFLGGNIRDTATLPLLNEIGPDDLIVLELDSWQLNSFGPEKISPELAVFTTFYPDHLNYYRDNLDTYLADKANIFLHQKSGDHLIMGEQAAPFLKKYRARGRGKWQRVRTSDFPAGWQWNLLGQHNRYNAALAIIAARTLGLSDEQIRPMIENFRGLPGRLELVAEKNSVKFFNDTTATTPDALRVALETLGNPARKLILIFGGADKNLNFSTVLPFIFQFCKQAILLPGTGTAKLLAAHPELSSYPQATTLEEALGLAEQIAQTGDIVLFSPGFASFGLFKNEFDRGEKFNKLVTGEK